MLSTSLHVCTDVQVDPTLTRADRLVGQVLGEVDALPDVFTELEINFFLLRRLLGVRTQVGSTHASLWHLLNFCYSDSRCACICKACKWFHIGVATCRVVRSKARFRS